MSSVVGNYELGSRAIHEPLLHLWARTPALQPVEQWWVIYDPAYTPAALLLSGKLVQDMVLDRLQTVSNVWHETSHGPAGGNGEHARHAEEVVRLLEEWMADASGYDEETWLERWNAYDVAAPNPNAVRRAMLWIEQMYEDALALGEEWHSPHVAADEDGDVMFEWWNEDKALTVYVSENDVRYIKGWGLNIETEMEDGEATTPERRRMLWTWLLD
jgi:hypothetical protein